MKTIEKLIELPEGVAKELLRWAIDQTPDDALGESCEIQIHIVGLAKVARKDLQNFSYDAEFMGHVSIYDENDRS